MTLAKDFSSRDKNVSISPAVRPMEQGGKVGSGVNIRVRPPANKSAVVDGRHIGGF